MKKEERVKHLWYKNAFFYAVIVDVFKDGNGDGIGDFIGLTDELDYLKNLGVTCIWLLPFYPTTGRDNGYDVKDYYNISSGLGTFEDFDRFIKEAKKRKIRVIIDLVVHHTSDEHPWFLAAKKDPKSKYKDYYIWTKKIEGPQHPSAFPGVESGVWLHDADVNAFYYHSFYRFEPDLNTKNPKVQKEIDKILQFWMEKGIDGFRMDAATLMFDRKGIPGTEIENPGPIMEHWHDIVKEYNPEGVILGEADVTPDKIATFFGTGGRMDLLFNFLLNRYIFLSFAKKDAEPMREFLHKLPVPPFAAQWVNFLRNHDELNIEQLRKEDQEIVYAAFAPSPGMRVYDRGIRRRLAPMFGDNLDRLKMAYSLLFSLPGSVMMLYGDEIGMGDDLRLPERVSVRLPMQWSDTKNAGFSTVNPSALVRSVLSTGEYSYHKVNASDQEKDPNSLMQHIKNLVAVRFAHPQIGHGVYKLLHTKPNCILGLSYDWEGDVIIILNNLSAEPCIVSLEEFKYAILTEFYSDGAYIKETDAMAIPMHSYGFRWFTVKKRD